MKVYRVTDWIEKHDSNLFYLEESDITSKDTHDHQGYPV